VNKVDKILIIFYAFLASSYGIYVFTTSEGLDQSLFELVLPKKITEFQTSRIVDVPNTQIFNVMADIENFPNILPKNVISVNILNQTDNVIIAEEELSETGIKTKLIVKHTITPYSEHVIEIIEGDAKGTKIVQSFEPIDSKTKLTTHVNLHLEGVTSFIAFLPESNLVHAINTIISHFVEYSKYDEYEKIVDTLYKEILNRPADKDGLLHYSTLLRNEEITKNELRQILLNSDEKASMGSKTIDELSDETIFIIDDLYEKILLRKADPEGMRYFGNLLESGTSSDEIRAILLGSDEGKNISPLHPIRNEITIIYKAIFDEFPEDTVVDYYHKMIDDELMTIEDVKNELKSTKNNNSK